MTLKEKFWNIIKKPQTDRPSECEKIADAFAIDFAEWCRDNAVRETTYSTEFTNNWELRYEQKIITTKELLTIYKKEKGL